MATPKNYLKSSGALLSEIVVVRRSRKKIHPKFQHSLCHAISLWYFSVPDETLPPNRATRSKCLCFRDRKGTPKTLCNKDFAELSGALSGAICLKNLVANWVVPSNLFRKFSGTVRAIFGFWASFVALDCWRCKTLLLFDTTCTRDSRFAPEGHWSSSRVLQCWPATRKHVLLGNSIFVPVPAGRHSLKFCSPPLLHMISLEL